MISKEMFIAAYRDGVIKFEACSTNPQRVLCQITDTFGILLEKPDANPLPPEAYKTDTPEDEAMNILFNSTQKLGGIVYAELEIFLAKKYPNLTKVQMGSSLMLQLVSDEELVKELLRRKAKLSHSSVHQILENAGYIASKLWSEEDLASQLVEDGYTASEENIAAVMNTGYLKALGECTDSDWQVISGAISAAEEYLEKAEEDEEESLDDDIWNGAPVEEKQESAPQKARNPYLQDARTTRFETMELFDKTVLFTDLRIDPETVPDGLFIYSLRHGDDDSEPATIEDKVIMENHFGDILSDEEFEFPVVADADTKYLEISEDDWSYLPDMMTVEEYLKRDKQADAE